MLLDLQTDLSLRQFLDSAQFDLKIAIRLVSDLVAIYYLNPFNVQSYDWKSF